MDQKCTLYWGDIHNHCGISYGHGSLERALALARQQLDFASVTGHAFWPDIPTDRARFGYLIDYHREGFARLHAGWDQVQQTFAKHDEKGRFVTFLSYEWHSRTYGDQHVLYQGTHGPLIGGETLADLRQGLMQSGQPFFLIPHHIGYPRGARGANWDAFDPSFTPVVEIFSLHGCAESDEAPYPFLNTMGPRDYASTAQAGLERGLRFGFVAATDHHAGYPGSYGDGRMAVYAHTLSRAAIWDAIQARRTYAVTGDKIAAQFRVNGTLLGGETGGTRRELSFHAVGADFWDTVEIIKNGRIWRRWAPTPGYTLLAREKAVRAKVRIEWGWSGPDQKAPWDMRLDLHAGRIVEMETCFRGDPVVRRDQIHAVEETIPHQVHEQSERVVSWTSTTCGNVTTRHPTTQAIIFTVEMPPEGILTLTANGYQARHTLEEVLGGARAHLTQGFRTPAVRIHRADLEQDYTFRATAVDDQPERETDYYYARLFQRNGQCAWISPVWVRA